MKLLILAQIPPPLHGQSLMVRTAVEGLPAHGVELELVNLRLSRSAADIGGWRAGKVLAILDACFHAVIVRFASGCDTLYYVPAPGKRGALYRDWLVMLLVRPFYRRLVLHFHNGGLGVWLAERATPAELGLTRGLLGRADLAVVLTESLRADAAALGARTIAVVPNGIADPCVAGPEVPRERDAILYLGSVSADKGVPALLAAVRLARARRPGLRLILAGEIEPAMTAELAAFDREQPGVLTCIGFVRGARKAEWLARAGCLCLPTRYAHEAQPLVALEALAAGCPLVASAWRGLPETLPPGSILFPPGDAPAIADALVRVTDSPPEPEELRAHFRSHFTLAAHLRRLADVLHALG